MTSVVPSQVQLENFKSGISLVYKSTLSFTMKAKEGR